jgi:transposase-like protein
MSHQPTEENRRLIRTLAGIGVPIKMVANQIGIDEKTLRKYYDDDIDVGQAKATSQIAKRLYDIAMSESKESLTACIFWLKCRAKWSTLDGPEVQVNVQNNSITTVADNEEIKRFKKQWETIDA